MSEGEEGAKRIQRRCSETEKPGSWADAVCSGDVLGSQSFSRFTGQAHVSDVLHCVMLFPLQSIADFCFLCTDNDLSHILSLVKNKFMMK